MSEIHQEKPTKKFYYYHLKKIKLNIFQNYFIFFFGSKSHSKQRRKEFFI